MSKKLWHYCEPALFPLFITCFFVIGTNAHSSPAGATAGSSPCFSIPDQPTAAMEKKVLTVGKNVSILTDPLCFEYTAVSPAPFLRLILVLDASASMCQEVTSCPGASNNDPLNIRVEAARMLVDSLAVRCNVCEIGVIVFNGVGNDSTGTRTVTRVVAPLALNSASNLNRVHSAISDAACSGRLPKIHNATLLFKRALTFTGIALDSAIKFTDAGYDTLTKYTVQRHIILFSDGDWQKPTPNDLIAAYKLNYPGRPFPTIHGVILSDTAAHLAAGYPPYGLLTCDSSMGYSVPVDFSFLQIMTQATVPPGIYMHGTTPLAIASVFNEFLMQHIPLSCSCLLSMIIVNSATSEVRTAVLAKDTGLVSGRCRASLPYQLQLGKNTFLIQMERINSLTGAPFTIIDTLIINRSTEEGTLPQSAFKPLFSSRTIQLFDLRGRLLKTTTEGWLSNRKLDLKGIYFIKFSDGKIERKMTVLR